MTHEEHGIRSSLASNPSITPKAQAILVNDEYTYVRLRLAGNPLVTLEAQAVLVTDERPDVRAAILNNPSLSPYIKSEMPRLIRDKLKKLQSDPDTNARAIAGLINSGLIDIADIKDVSFHGISRWRRELGRALSKTSDSTTRLSQAARALGVPKESLAAMLRKSLGAEVAADWVKRDYFSRAEVKEAAGKPGLLYMAEKTRGGTQAPGEDMRDSSLSFFDPEIDYSVQQAFSKAQAGSGHPPGFAFSLFRRFDDGKGDAALMTEIQSDVLSTLYSPGKDYAAQGIWKDQLEEVRKLYEPKRGTWVKEVFRNTARYLFNHGVDRVYAITPESLHNQLHANPPQSVVKEWLGESAAKAEGFGDRTTIKVGGVDYEAWDAISKDSPAGQEILYSKEDTDPAFQKASAEGKTKLNYRQWVQARTPEFKNWFGDWEAALLRQKIDATPVIEATTDALRQDGSRKELQRDAVDSYRGKPEVTNKDTGKIIKIAASGLNNSLQHGMNLEKRAVISILDQLVENGIFVARDTENMRPGVKAVETFASRVSVDGKPFVARIVVREVQDGRRFYDHELSTLENERLTSTSGGSEESFISRPSEPRPLASLGNKVLQSALAVNPATVSKVVDPETGEPRVVYHGTAQGEHFWVFDKGRLGTSTKAEDAKKAFFASSSRAVAESYTDYIAPATKDDLKDAEAEVNEALKAIHRVQAEYKGRENDPDARVAIRAARNADYVARRNLEFARQTGKHVTGNVYALFLNVKNPLRVAYDPQADESDWIRNDAVSRAPREGRDGVILKVDGYENLERFREIDGYANYAFFDPNQAKSATGNTGEFSPKNDEIYRQDAENRDWRSLRDETIAQLRKDYSKPITLESKDGDAIIVSFGGLRHALNLGVPKPEKTLIARHIQEVIRQSARGDTVPDNQGRKDPATKTSYYADAKIDGVPYQVSIVVRNHSDGKRYYDHTVVTRKSPEDQQGRSEAGASSPIPSSSGLAFSINELGDVF
ncbi:MAG: hypothetical protein LBJ76_00030, partial [Candidatus Accumulibacter sp.]|nr:hypothetical protein [Accumulibacter sp.]